jgi:hypothetical protein
MMHSVAEQPGKHTLPEHGGYLNYPTFAAIKWLKRSPEAADNWSLVFDAFDRGELSPGLLRLRFEQHMTEGMDPEQDVLAFRLLRWFASAVCWEEAHEDLAQLLSAGNQVQYSYSELLKLEEHQARTRLLRRQRYGVLHTADALANLPTAICGWWLLAETPLPGRMLAERSHELQTELVQSAIEQAVGHAQARNAQLAQILNWILRLVEYESLPEYMVQRSLKPRSSPPPHELAAFMGRPEGERRRAGLIGLIQSWFA